MDPNPYSAPSQPAGQFSRYSGERELCAWLALSLAAIPPAIFLWEHAARLLLLPEIPMGNLYFNCIFTLSVFVLTMLSVPLGVMGVRSRIGVVAGFAAVLGIVESTLIFYVKFYPVLYPPTP